MAKDKVKETLKDPKSAQFKNVMFRNVGNSPVICGEVNSKNSFGGYIGFQRFLSDGENLVYLEEQVADFDAAWNRLCL